MREPYERNHEIYRPPGGLWLPGHYQTCQGYGDGSLLFVPRRGHALGADRRQSHIRIPMGALSTRHSAIGVSEAVIF
jgi:hypothetical protein